MYKDREYGSKIQEAIDEAAAISSRKWALGILADEKAFMSCVSSICHLLGYSSIPSKPSQMVNRHPCSCCFELCASACRETRLNIWELSDVLNTMDDECDRHGKKYAFSRPDALLNAIPAWARYIRFEPEWHRKSRGDNRSLPTSKNPNRDMWGYLRKLYTNPEACRLRQPDGISAMEKMYPGYKEKVARARREGQDELKRIYGPDADVSIVTDITKRFDEKEASFVSSLKDGSFGAIFDAN